jgi:hypothetical protein
VCPVCCFGRLGATGRHFQGRRRDDFSEGQAKTFPAMLNCGGAVVENVFAGDRKPARARNLPAGACRRAWEFRPEAKAETNSLERKKERITDRRKRGRSIETRHGRQSGIRTLIPTAASRRPVDERLAAWENGGALNEPFRLYRWKPRTGLINGQLLTCARPGRCPARSANPEPALPTASSRRECPSISRSGRA